MYKIVGVSETEPKGAGKREFFAFRQKGTFCLSQKGDDRDLPVKFLSFKLQAMPAPTRAGPAAAAAVKVQVKERRRRHDGPRKLELEALPVLRASLAHHNLNGTRTRNRSA